MTDKLNQTNGAALLDWVTGLRQVVPLRRGPVPTGGSW